LFFIFDSREGGLILLLEKHLRLQKILGLEGITSKTLQQVGHLRISLFTYISGRRTQEREQNFWVELGGTINIKLHVRHIRFTGLP
jgi:hypothetical protein